VHVVLLRDDSELRSFSFGLEMLNINVSPEKIKYMGVAE
jgi:hypothetical protein